MQIEIRVKISKFPRNRLVNIQPMVWALVVWALVLCAVGRMDGQRMSSAYHSDNSSMHRHYDAAYRFQASGDFVRADAEHTHFLVIALEHLANFRANIGEYANAAPAYAEALTLAPADFELLINYAGAALDAHDAKKAYLLLQTAMDLDAKSITNRQKAEMHRMIGTALRALDKNKDAIAEFHVAIALDPNIDNQCALGDVVLNTEGANAAAAIFAKVIAQFGDTAAVHMRIGRIYALGGSPDVAVEEFKKAIAKDYGMPGAHYSLGASYMTDAARDFPDAEKEFRKELALHPNDTFSYPQLGYIALTQHDYQVAELDYKRAIALNPLAADNFMQLGKLYMETKRLAEAEAAFRNTIALTVDPSSNFYAVERAHYRLGRLLMARGDKSEGEQELHISEDLLAQRDRQSASKLNGEEVMRNPLEKTKVVTPREAEELKTFAMQIGPLIAGSYNNLGVHAAMREDFAKAAGYFQLAAKWNPSLPGVESNWGRAAFTAHDCAQATAPLQASLEIHPSDPELGAMLDQCQRGSSLVPKN